MSSLCSLIFCYQIINILLWFLVVLKLVNDHHPKLLFNDTILAYINMYMLTKIKCIHAHISTYVCFLNWLLYIHVKWIYQHYSLSCTFREIILTYGLWDQLRVDKGKEWYLSLFVNEKLSCHRYSTRKLPHLQTSSKKVAKCLCGRDAGIINPWYYCYRIIPLKGYG